CARHFGYCSGLYCYRTSIRFDVW
nr:immunoglobulin heavy chain junction region [Macaca mulatta]